MARQFKKERDVVFPFLPFAFWAFKLIIFELKPVCFTYSMWQKALKGLFRWEDLSLGLKEKASGSSLLQMMFCHEACFHFWRMGQVGRLLESCTEWPIFQKLGVWFGQLGGKGECFDSSIGIWKQLYFIWWDLVWKAKWAPLPGSPSMSGGEHKVGLFDILLDKVVLTASISKQVQQKYHVFTCFHEPFWVRLLPLSSLRRHSVWLSHSWTQDSRAGSSLRLGLSVDLQRFLLAQSHRGRNEYQRYAATTSQAKT